MPTNQAVSIGVGFRDGVGVRDGVVVGVQHRDGMPEQIQAVMLPVVTETVAVGVDPCRVGSVPYFFAVLPSTW